MTTSACAGDRRPLPQPDDESRAYWEGARQHQLVILRCRSCGFYIHYPKRACPRCAGNDIEPSRVSGHGVVHSFTICHHKGAPGFEERVPFVVVLVELVEQPGLRLVANIVGCDAGTVRIGMPVEVTFEDVSGDVTLPQFRPRASS